MFTQSTDLVKLYKALGRRLARRRTLARGPHAHRGGRRGHGRLMAAPDVTIPNDFSTP